jgi:hypothetical protein
MGFSGAHGRKSAKVNAQLTPDVRSDFKNQSEAD